MLSLIPIRKRQIHRRAQQHAIKRLTIHLLTTLQHQAICCGEILGDNQTGRRLHHDSSIVKLNILRKAFDNGSLSGIWHVGRDVLLYRKLFSLFRVAKQLVFAEVLVNLKIKLGKIGHIVTTEGSILIFGVRVLHIKLETIRAIFELLEPRCWSNW